MDNMTPLAELLTACNLAELAAAGDLSGLQHRARAIPPEQRAAIPRVLAAILPVLNHLTTEDKDLDLGVVLSDVDHPVLAFANLMAKGQMGAPECCDDCWVRAVAAQARIIAVVSGAVFGTEGLDWRWRNLAAAVSVPRFGDHMLPQRPVNGHQPPPAPEVLQVPAPRYTPPQM